MPTITSDPLRSPCWLHLFLTTLFAYTTGKIKKKDNYKCKYCANREDLNLHIKLTPRKQKQKQQKKSNIEPTQKMGAFISFFRSH